MRLKVGLIIWVLCLSAWDSASGHSLDERYYAGHPVTIVCDWDKPPYEFMNDQGKPAGINVDLLRRLCDELGIPCKFIMKEWSTAIKAFERGEADLILANSNRYRKEGYYTTENIINYNRICAAKAGDSIAIITREKLMKEGMVLKYGDYTKYFFLNEDGTEPDNIEFQSSKVALQGLLNGDYKYFVWGEEPLKWKIKTLNIKGVCICEADIPVSEIRIIGRDRELIYEIDDLYSRLKQSGEVQRLKDRWLHPERNKDTSPTWILYTILTALALIALLLVLNRISKAHVNRATRTSRNTNMMMTKALKMGNVHVMVYDIANDRMANHYGAPFLPAEGITLEEFTAHIHPDEKEEFKRKMGNLLTGREHKFVLKKRWKTYGEDSHWLKLDGHAIVEADKYGRPAYIVNALHEITQSERSDDLKHEKEISDAEYSEQLKLTLVQLKQELQDTQELARTRKFWLTYMLEQTDSYLIYSDLANHQISFYRNLQAPEYTFSIHDFCNHYLAGEYGETFQKILNDSESRATRTMTIRLKRHSAQELGTVFIDTLRPIIDDKGIIIGHEGISYDITAITKARFRLQEITAKAEKSVQEKSAFMASMTHELRTPLNAIIGFTSILQTIDSPEERSEYLRIIQNSCDMLQRLINDVIEASDANDSPKVIVPVKVDFSKTFDDICLTLRQRAAQKPELAFLTDNPFDTLAICVDVERIVQFLTNFMTNALKFTKKGHIRIGYTYKDKGLYLYCEDTGIGIPKEQQAVIFDRFTKLDEFVQGTGMGLNICKSLVERMGGQIGVESEGKDMGTKFWIWIPCERMDN
jgi:signal transduction histidine kinase/ABC-type amino acid transport substrate-binding protein